MCERYVIPDQAQVEREFSVARRWWRFSASFNVATPRYVPAIRLYEGETEGVMLRWGLIPSWAEGRPLERSLIHIEAERVEHAEACRQPWLNSQRCILPFAGFYAWQLTPAGYRQPFYIRLGQQPVFGVAGLWDRSVTDDDDVIESCTVLTVPANPLVAEIDNRRRRMPVILRREDYDTWLRCTPAQAKALLAAWPQEQMQADPVSPRVNSLRYDDPGLIAPVN